MKNRFVVSTVSTIVCGSLIFTGCATAGRSAGAGAGLGAGLGAIIGHQSGHAGEGALIGAAVGALAGWGAHRIKARVQAKRTAEAQATATQYNYTPDQGLKLDLRGGSVSPATVKPGETVSAKVEYALLGTGDSGAAVTETRSLSTESEAIGKINEEKVNRTDGTWESTIEFQVPENASPGKYTLAQGVAVKDSSLTNNVAFELRPKTAKSGESLPQEFEVALILTN